MSRLEMWVDAGSVEVFLADGSLTFSTAIDLGDPASLTIEHEGVTERRCVRSRSEVVAAGLDHLWPRSNGR